MSSSAPPPSSQTESEKKLQSEIDDLQEQLKLKTNECDFLEAEQKKTKGQLTASEETAGKLKSELEAAHAAVGDACDLLTPEQHETRTAQLRSNVSELEVLVKERNAELGRMGEKCSAAEKERDDLKARVTSLTRDVEDASKSEKDLQAQVDLLTSKLEQERGMSAGFKGQSCRLVELSSRASPPRLSSFVSSASWLPNADALSAFFLQTHFAIERAVSAELDLQTAKSRVQRRPSTPTSATPSSAGLGPPSSAATSTQRTSHESSTTGVELRKSQLAYYKGQLDSVPRASESLTPEKLGDIKLNEYYYAPSTRRSLNIGDTPSNEKNTKDVKKRLVMTQWDAIPNDAANSMYARCKALIQATCDVSAGYKANLVEVGILVDYLSHTDPSWRRSDQLYQAYAMFEIAFTNLNRPKVRILSVFIRLSNRTVCSSFVFSLFAARMSPPTCHLPTTRTRRGLGRGRRPTTVLVRHRSSQRLAALPRPPRLTPGIQPDTPDRIPLVTSTSRSRRTRRNRRTASEGSRADLRWAARLLKGLSSPHESRSPAWRRTHRPR